MPVSETDPFDDIDWEDAGEPSEQAAEKAEEPAGEVMPRRRRRRTAHSAGDAIWNSLTALILLLMLGVVGSFFLIFNNPATPLNPFPPPTVPVLIVLPSSTPRPTAAPATATVAPLPSETLTPEPSQTNTPTMTATILGTGPTQVPSGTSSVRTNYAFSLKSAPAAIDAAIPNPDRVNCQWMGVAGQVLDLKGGPAVGISVQVGGFLGGYALILYPSLTGTALNYGTAGYEVTLGDKPVASTQSVWVQLLDQQRLPLSPRVYFDTFDDCKRSLIIVNFQQVR